MIKKAVIPAAGYGTRLLPATKSQPKEMLPIVDKPVIQYVVEEAVAAGVTDILMVIGKGKRAIEEHFDRNRELESELRAKGRIEEAEALQRICDMANIHFVWQKELRGLGDAINCGRHHVGNEPFLVLLGDTLIESEIPVSRRLIEVFDHYNASVVALEAVEPAKVSRYGIAGGRTAANDLIEIETLIEKPTPEQAPSNLAVAARYVFTPQIFDYIDRTTPGKNGEIQITDAMQLMLKDSAIYGYRLTGKRHDVGNRLDFLKTNIAYGLQRPDIAPELRDYLAKLSSP